jgi:hypothetical protein
MKIRTLISLIWRNNPNGAVTFGVCPVKECNSFGRGGDICLLCCEKELAKIVGEAKAKRFVKAVREVRLAQKELDELAEEEEDEK